MESDQLLLAAAKVVKEAIVTKNLLVDDAKVEQLSNTMLDENKLGDDAWLNSQLAKFPTAKQPGPINVECLPESVDCRFETTLKFSQLPKFTTAKKKASFKLQSDGWVFHVRVGKKAFNKAIEMEEAGKDWLAVLAGKIGEKTDQGYELTGAALQVFEKKPKPPKEEKKH